MRHIALQCLHVSIGLVRAEGIVLHTLQRLLDLVRYLFGTLHGSALLITGLLQRLLAGRGFASLRLLLPGA